MPFAAAISGHPDPSHAVGEVIGDVLERHGPRPDLAVLFLSAAHASHSHDIAQTVVQLLDPGHLVGCTAGSVVGDDVEREYGPALSLWCAWFRQPVDVVHLDAVRGPDGTTISGLDRARFDAAGLVLVLAEPLSFPLDEVLMLLRGQGSTVPIVGGIASAGFAPGANRMLFDSTVVSRGAVCVLIPPEAATIDTVVSQGCRPVGNPFTVTNAERNVLREIAGHPAHDRLVQTLLELPEPDRLLARHGVHLGRVIDDHRLDFGPGDFLVRSIVDADRTTGHLVINDVVDVGDTVQFHLRDANAADDDLRAMLTGRAAEGALLFTCNGRGSAMFGEPSHDAEVTADYLDRPALAGMSCAGEVGPIGGQTFLHSFTASLALFSDARSLPRPFEASEGS